MLEVRDLTKNFDNKKVLEKIKINFEKGKIYGVIGINGAGKSTLLRTMAGIYRPTEGGVYYENENVYDSVLAMGKIFYITDETPPLMEKTIEKYIKYYELIYGERNIQRYEKLKSFFDFDVNEKMANFSKGMKKKAFLFITLCFDMDYLLLDETFEGIDPVIRIKIKQLLVEEVKERNIGLIITSHNVTELEKFCDETIMINNNKIEIMDNEEEKNIFKVQVAFAEEKEFEDCDDIVIISEEVEGSVRKLIVQGDENVIKHYFESMQPAIFDMLALNVEELMIYKVKTGKY